MSNTALYQRIARDPAFVELQRRRSVFNWSLTVFLLSVYYGFILVIAYKPEWFAIPLGPDTVITIAIPVGFSIIVLSLLLTAVYVFKTNRDFDPALRSIVETAEKATQ